MWFWAMRGFIAYLGGVARDRNTIGAKDGKGMKDVCKNVCAIISWVGGLG